MSQRRFTDKPALDPGAVMELGPDHPAMAENRTLFPSTVVEVTADEPDRLLVSGKNNRKLGQYVEKGIFKGYALFGFSLEERATCPADCGLRGACYGNGMQLARRHRIGDPDTFYDRLGLEILDLLDAHPDGLLVRLHVLGDFPDVEYVSFWKEVLDENPKVAIYGYTHRQTTAWGGDEIGDAIEAVKEAHPARFRIRWSSPVSRPDGAVVIDRVPDTPRVDEGLVCPAQTDKSACCATCGLCWSADTVKDCIAFIRHGKSDTAGTAKRAMQEAERDDFDDAVVAAMPKAKLYALKLCKDPTLADDLVQEAAARAFANRDGFELGSNMQSWFITILRNAFINKCRKEKWEQEDIDGVLTAAMSADATQEDGLAAQQDLAKLDDLTDEHRTVLEDVGEGLSIKEIAEKRGIEEGTVRTRIHRARNALGEAVENGIAPGKDRRIKPIAMPSNMKPAVVDPKPPEVRLVDPASLKVEAAYQRDLSAKSIRLIRKIVTGFDWTKFKLPICDEGLNVIDGQHTAIAAATHPFIKQIPVLVVSAERIETRAKSFVSHNRDRLNMTPAQVFYAECTAGVKEAKDILKIVVASEAEIPRSQPAKWKPGQISAVGELRAAYRAVGPEVTARIVKIGVAAKCTPLSATILRAIRIMGTEPAFDRDGTLTDDQVASALASIKDFEKRAQTLASETDQSRYRAGAVLIHRALDADVPALEGAA